jgi:hypothetical protein
MKRYICTPGTLSLSCAVLVIMLTPASAQPVDFTVSGFGPHHVVQGYDLIFDAIGTVVSGVDQEVTVTLSGVPAATTVHFINMERFCCGKKLYTLDSDDAIRLTTSASTPVGTYNVMITYTTDQGVSRSTTWPVYVDPMPALVQKTGGTYFPPLKPLTMQNQWNANMLSYGTTYCVPSQVGTYDLLVWYYDGVRNYYQIADATGDPKWNACAQMIAAGYQQYVLQNNGDLPGYRIFARGLSLDYQRSNSSLSQQAFQALVAYTAGEFNNTAWVVSWYTSRETAYALEAQLENEKLGAAPTPMRDDLVTAAIGQVDQWFYSKTADYVQPFMVALTAEALIQYWDATHDPRIPGTVQAIADGLWANNWDATCQCFPYQNGAPPTPTTADNDENLLIAPLYGWVYKQTGFSGYRDMGDQIFNAGVSSGWVGTGKFFSMDYRWSGKYIEWRNGTAATQPMTSSPLSCDLNGDSKVNVLDVQIATNQALGYAACGSADLNGDSRCTVIDVQRIISSSLGASCHLGP